MIVVSGEVLPEAWERSIALLWRNGFRVYTEYGEYSIDSPIAIKVLKPCEEPRIHLKGIVVGRLSQLFDYVDEVLYGINDWRVGKDWHYTYHERLFNYTVNGNTVNQIEYVIKKLKKVPYSRRAQAITWKPWKDINVDSPPCLQRAWFRVMEDKLVLHVHLRSLDYREPVLIFHDGEVELIPIGEVYEEGLWKNSSVPSVGEDLKIEWMPVTNCIRHELGKSEKIYEVRLLSGRWIRLTRDHALFTYRGGRIVAVPTIALKKGDLVLISKRIPRPTGLVNVPSLILRSKATYGSNRSYFRIINVDRDEIKKLKRMHSIVPRGKASSMIRKHGTGALVKSSLDSDVTFDVVKEIREVEPTCNYAYDLSVPPHENFIGGHAGIVVHNSNDALKAAFMNMIAFTELQRSVAKKLGIKVGYYLHVADSYHVYERDWKWAEKFVEQIESGRSKRYWLTTEDFAKLAKVKNR